MIYLTKEDIKDISLKTFQILKINEKAKKQKINNDIKLLWDKN